jgi:hypothetical protein
MGLQINHRLADTTSDVRFACRSGALPFPSFVTSSAARRNSLFVLVSIFILHYETDRRNAFKKCRERGKRVFLSTHNINVRALWVKTEKGYIYKTIVVRKKYLKFETGNFKITSNDTTFQNIIIGEM